MATGFSRLSPRPHTEALGTRLTTKHSDIWMTFCYILNVNNNGILPVYCKLRCRKPNTIYDLQRQSSRSKANKRAKRQNSVVNIIKKRRMNKKIVTYRFLDWFIAKFRVCFETFELVTCHFPQQSSFGFWVSEELPNFRSPNCRTHWRSYLLRLIDFVHSVFRR